VVQAARSACRTRGQAIVEFAFILPVFLLIVLGMIEIGRGFVFGVAVQDGAREAARLAANTRVNSGLTTSLQVGSTVPVAYTNDAYIIQRVIDASAPAMLGCSLPATATTSTPITANPPYALNCGGGNWTVALNITTQSGTTYSTFSDPAFRASRDLLNGATVEAKVKGSVSLLAGLVTGWRGLQLYQVNVQGDAVMVAM
jgi:Flp pilus assembly protein TadG